jgi:hypothetical protein
MLVTMLFALLLVAITVVVHCTGLVVVVRRLSSQMARALTGRVPLIRLLVEVTWMLVVLHALEIAIWAWFYRLAGVLPDAETAFYFSGVTYATVGYGDVVLAQPWRMLGPIEGLAGILMCGLSTALFLAIVTRLIAPRLKADAPVKA